MGWANTGVLPSPRLGQPGAGADPQPQDGLHVAAGGSWRPCLRSATSGLGLCGQAASFRVPLVLYFGQDSAAPVPGVPPLQSGHEYRDCLLGPRQDLNKSVPGKYSNKYRPLSLSLKGWVLELPSSRHPPGAQGTGVDDRTQEPRCSTLAGRRHVTSRIRIRLLSRLKAAVSRATDRFTSFVRRKQSTTPLRSSHTTCCSPHGTYWSSDPHTGF